MPRLIDADELKKWLERWKGYLDDDMIRRMQICSKDIPTAEERKKGKWILSDEQRQEDVDNGNYRFVCSECGKSDLHSKEVTVSFCWNCGADMRGEKDAAKIH